jgi:catechol 2,3-dioxygenase-like lactoylglutathione lyase family enzyme
MDTQLDRASEFVGDRAREAIPANRFNLTGIDHVGIPTRNPDLAGAFVEQILGGIEIYRAGYTDADRKIGRLRHIFYHVGAQLVEVVELEDERGYADQTNPHSLNTNPHWAFGATPEGVAAFAEHLKQQGIPFDGPRSHYGTSVVSVYFRDCEGNNMEVTTWKPFGPETMTTTPMGGSYGFIPWKKLSHGWRPRT